MKAIITIIGKDRVGILAEIARFVSEARCNVEDIQQTIMQGNFVMMMMVSLDTSPLSFEEIRSGLDKVALTADVSIRIQRTEIFDEMYHV